MPMASGGYVTRPTNALVGEGAEPEYVIPESRMSGAMERYSGGARGKSVINGAGFDQEEGGFGSGAGGTETFRLETTVINSVEYATVEQVRAMGVPAAQQGQERRANGAVPPAIEPWHPSPRWSAMSMDLSSQIKALKPWRTTWR